MMPGIQGAALLHKQLTESYIDTAGTTVTVRQAPAKVASGGSVVNKVLGTKAALDGAGVETEVTAVIAYTSSGVKQDARKTESAPIGLYDSSDVILMVKLAEVLDDPTKPQGMTIFDTAKEVLIQGTYFKKTGSERTGLPPYGPYILWVGLKTLGVNSAT
jgi:hypothetical protein